jgi:hypothetical protein
MKLKYLVLSLLAAVLLSVSAMAEDAPAGQGSTGVSFNGYFKSAIFGGQNDGNEPLVLGDYAEFDIKADAVKENFGKAFVEMRIDSGNNNGVNNELTPDIREAWVETQAGIFDIKFGRQIIVWGRADSINPTNNLTPYNSLIYSSEFDDTRLGNELLQATVKLNPAISLEGEWVPLYRSDSLPFAKLISSFPAGFSVGNSVFPGSNANAGSWGARANFTAGWIDGSISYYNGYKTLPGFDYSLSMSGMALIPTAYRIRALGGDFSTALGDFGLRGEICAKFPEKSEDDNVYIPAKQLQYVAGLDRTVGDFNFLVQYSGVYVVDFQPIDETVLSPLDVMRIAMKKLNRQFTGTLDQASHSVTGQAGYSALNDTLHIKLAGMYDFTTREFVICPDVSYDIADAFIVTATWRDLDGPADSLNRLVSRIMGFSSVELKYSF